MGRNLPAGDINVKDAVEKKAGFAVTPSEKQLGSIVVPGWCEPGPSGEDVRMRFFWTMFPSAGQTLVNLRAPLLCPKKISVQVTCRLFPVGVLPVFYEVRNL
ncbi:MAG: hypothetical protein O2780_01125 [Proteobacteria bacterium]|nr:hypothetical protein [Pseudomonadota bacterium]